MQNCEAIRAQITVAAVVDRMIGSGHQFVAKSPKVAVADVIRRYTDKKLKITKKGQGRDPNIYKWMEGENV